MNMDRGRPSISLRTAQKGLDAFSMSLCKYRGAEFVRSVYDPDGLLRTFLDSGGLSFEINKISPGGHSEASRAVLDFSGFRCPLVLQGLAKPLFVGSNPTATSNPPEPGGVTKVYSA
jgi:hypothetical protein